MGQNEYVPGQVVWVRVGDQNVKCVVMWLIRRDVERGPLYRCRVIEDQPVIPRGVDYRAPLMGYAADMSAADPRGVTEAAPSTGRKRGTSSIRLAGERVWTWDATAPVPIPCGVKINYAAEHDDAQYTLVTETSYREFWEKGQELENVPTDMIFDTFDSAYLDMQNSRYKAGLELLSKSINQVEQIGRDLKNALETLT